MKPSTTANVIQREGEYHLFMMVEGYWMHSGYTSPDFAAVCDVADRECDLVLINAPLTEPSAYAIAA